LLELSCWFCGCHSGGYEDSCWDNSPVSYWFTLFLRDSQWEVTSCLEVSSCFLYNLVFPASELILLPVGFLLGLFFKPQNGDDAGCFSKDYTALYPSRYLFFIYSCTITENVVLTGGNNTTIRHNTQIIHISQNNTPNLQTTYTTQKYKNNDGHTTHNEYNANTITAISNTITITINKK
jgi:hypothetical protein